MLPFLQNLRSFRTPFRKALPRIYILPAELNLACRTGLSQINVCRFIEKQSQTLKNKGFSPVIFAQITFPSLLFPGVEGFEPSLAVLETDILPLDDTPKALPFQQRCNDTRLKGKSQAVSKGISRHFPEFLKNFQRNSKRSSIKKTERLSSLLCLFLPSKLTPRPPPHCEAPHSRPQIFRFRRTV